MNTPSSLMNDSPLSPSENTPTAISEFQRLYWSVRRELWENHSIYIAPLAAAGVILFGFLITMIRVARQSNLQAFVIAHHTDAITFPYDVAAGLIMATVGIVSIFYCLEALHGERSDRSILFWKSLPVSDLTAVLAKAFIPFVILPLVAFAITVATQSLMLLLFSAARLFVGGNAPAPWIHAPLFPMSLLLLYHLFAIHSLWYAPIYGWLLLVSAWARRAPFLWAFLPPLAIIILEKIIFNTNHFAQMLGHRFGGGDRAVSASIPGAMPMDPGMHITLGRFLSTPGLWVGLVITAIFIAAAVQLRRYRSAL